MEGNARVIGRLSAPDISFNHCELSWVFEGRREKVVSRMSSVEAAMRRQSGEGDEELLFRSSPSARARCFRRYV